MLPEPGSDGLGALCANSPSRESAIDSSVSTESFASKRAAEDPASSPNKRPRTASPTASPPVSSSSAVSPSSSGHSSHASVDQQSSAAPTEPFSAEERELHNRRNEIKLSRARQLEAHLIEATEKLKHSDYGWLSSPMVILIQPFLSYVLMHENRFDAQIEGLRAEFRVGYEVLAVRIAGLDTRISDMETKFDAGLTAMETKFNDRMTDIETNFNDRMTDMETNFNNRMTDMETKFDARMTRLETKLDACMSSMDIKLNAILAAMKA